MKVPDVTPDLFFKVGRACFLIIGIASLINFIDGFQFLNIPSIISQGSSIFFNFVTAGFFHYMLKQSNTSMPESLDNSELKEVMKEFGK